MPASVVATELGERAIEVAFMAGMEPDPWQQLLARLSLAQRADGKWAAFEVGAVVSRQNGKGGFLEIRELAGLFLLGERLIIHSAHQFDTSLEAFYRLRALIEGCPQLMKRVAKFSEAHGKEGVLLKNGQRLRYRARTKGGGRGFSGDCLVLDEAMEYPESAHGALLPTLSAHPNPQVIYTGSAVDQEKHKDGVVFARVRERGLAGDDDSLLYAEWSADGDINNIATLGEISQDPNAWAVANPGLGYRITPEYIEQERKALDIRTFAVERLGIGDWPSTDGAGNSPIASDAWTELTDPTSQISGPVCFSFDVSPDRSWSAICAAGHRDDDLAHVEVIAHRPGTGWVVDRLVDLTGNHDSIGVKCDQSSPAASLLPELSDRGVEVDALPSKEHAQGCGRIFDAVEQKTLRHLGTPELFAAIKGAAKRPLGDSWAWSRKSSAVDITPLVGVTLALWGLEGASEPLIAWGR